MSKRFQVVKDGVVVNVAVFDDGASLQNNAVVVGNEPPHVAPDGAIFMAQDGAGIGWTLSNGVLSAPVRAVPPMTTDQLIAYANAKQWRLATGGRNITIGGTPRLFTTDPTSFSLITGASVRLQQPNAPTSIDWQFETGFVTLASADFIAAAINIADFMQSTFDALKAVLASIASGSITTAEQVDAASWPTP